MSLPVPNLDDRKFQDIVDEAKRKIPEFCPEWTNHNVADPGVALIELFAWMTEATLYRVNQIPERLYIKFLEMMGVSRLPAVPATTDLTFWLSGVPDEPVVVPAGTPVGTVGADSGQDVAFITTQALPIRQPKPRACLTGSSDRFTDRWQDLQYGKEPFRVFSSLDEDADEPPEPGITKLAPPDLDAADAMYLGFAEPLSRHVVELVIEANARGWGIPPEAPPRRWEASTADGWEECRIFDDDTGGLNRNGSVLIEVPAAHVQHTISGQSWYWLRVRLIAPKVGSYGYLTTPVLKTWQASTRGASVPAQHSELHGPEELGVSDGTAGQVFTVSRFPVLPRDPVKDPDEEPQETVRVVSAESSHSWAERPNFDHSGPSDRHFTWDSATGEIRFGPEIRHPDGSVKQHGARPPDGSVISVTAYRTGGGAHGNVGRGQLRRLLTTVPYIQSVENPEPATGGLDAETMENLKTRGPLHIRSADRIVTSFDYTRAALAASPQVKRAECLPPLSPGAPVRLLLVPKPKPRRRLAIDDLALTEDLVKVVGDYIDARRMIGTSVEIRGPYYEGVSVAARLEATPGTEAGPVAQEATEVLYRYIDPLTGGPDGSGWPFGVDLTVAEIRTVLTAVKGVASVLNVVLLSADLRGETRVESRVDVVRARPGTLFMSYEHRVEVKGAGADRP